VNFYNFPTVCPRHSPNYSGLRVADLVQLIRGWGLETFRTGIVREWRPIDLSIEEADLLLSVFQPARPSRYVFARTDALADRMGVLSDSFKTLSDLDRLVLYSGRKRGFVEKLFPRPLGARLWKEGNPIGMDSLAVPLVAAAFGDGTFQRKVGGLLNANIKRRVLLPRGQWPSRLTLSPVLFCCLVAMSVRPTRPPRIHSACATMRDFALQLALGPRWAGFWEQWVLREFLSVNQLELSGVLAMTLEALPLIAEGAPALESEMARKSVSEADDDDGSVEKSGAAPGPILPAENWHETVPIFARRMLAGSI